MIDHVMLMNLKRREDKWFFALGALRAFGFPFFGDNAPWGDTIIRFISHDAEDYENTEDVMAAAVADGFPYFERFEHRSDQAKRILSWMWTFNSALRKIAEMDKIVMLLIDDMLPRETWTWGRLNSLMNECKNLKGLQLRRNCRGDLYVPPVPPFTSLLQQGFAGANDNGVVLSGNGAEIMLEVGAEHFGNGDTPQIFEEVARRGLTDRKYFEGFYSVLEAVIDMGCYFWESDLWK